MLPLRADGGIGPYGQQRTGIFVEAAHVAACKAFSLGKNAPKRPDEGALCPAAEAWSVRTRESLFHSSKLLKMKFFSIGLIVNRLLS